MPDLSGFSTLLGTLLGAGIGFFAQWISGRRQITVEELRQQHALRVARYDRLHGIYETVLGVALVLRDATARLIVLADNESADARERELASIYAAAAQDLRLALVRMLLHQETSAVRERFERLLEMVDELRTLERDKREGDRHIRGTALGDKRREIFQQLTELIAAMRLSLEEAEQSETLRLSPPARAPWWRRWLPT